LTLFFGFLDLFKNVGLNTDFYLELFELGLDLADLEDDRRTRRFLRLLGDVTLVDAL
jgi:hypothetical protein